MFFRKIKSKQGSSTVYELLISLTLLTFVMMFPLGIFSYLRVETSVNDVATLSMQTLERDGQLTPELIETINSNLKAKNLPELGNNGTILITNMNVSKKVGDEIVSQLNYGFYGKQYNQFVFVNSDTINAKFNGVSTSKSVQNSITGYTRCGYLKKYRNAFILANEPYNVWYDIKCNNPTCVHKGEIQYLSSGEEFACPTCGNVSTLETCNEANVVYLTIAVPVTNKVAFLNRVMHLISFGVDGVNVADADAVFNEQNIGENSSNLIRNNEKYYFIKTLYGTAEKYYDTTGGL